MRFESTQDNSKYTNVITRSNRNSNNSLGLLLATAATTTTTSTKVFRRHMYLLIIALVALSPVSSESSIGCKIDPKVCDQSEFCLDDSYLGICVSRDDQPIKESLRSEALFYNTEEDRAPIRIHKYNIDDEYDQIDQDNNLEQNELVDIKRDNINDNYMDLERINLYSEKTKRRSKEPTLTEILNMASLSDMPKEEVESEEEPDEYYDKNLDLSNSLSDDLEDYNYEDLLVDDNSASNNNNKAKDNLIDLLFEATSPVEEAEANDYSSSDYSDYPDDYEGQDYEDDERSKRSAELVIDSPGLVLDSSNNLLLRPVLAEAAGEDENGNSFYEQDLVVNGVGLDQPQEISTLDTNTIGRIIDNLQKENDLIEEVIETAEVNNQESPIEAELDKAIEQELTEQDLEDAVEENKADSLDEALESAVDKFILDLKTGDESQSKVNQEEDRLVKKDAVDDQQEQHQSQDPSSYSDSDLGKSGHFGVIDPSWITIEFSDKLNPDQSYNVLSYIAYRLKLPLEPFLKEYTIQDKTLSFRFESQQVTSKELADSISNLADEIQKETGLSIVSCGIGQKNNQLLLEKVLLSFNPKSEKFLLITVVSCLSLVLIILVLLVVFLVRRRSQLKAKLANDLGHKYDFEKVAVSNDEESLISSNSSSNAPHNRFWLLTYVPFVGRKTDKCHPGNADPRIANLQDLCRMRMDKTNSMSKPVGEMTVNTSSEIHSSSHALVSPVAGPSANINSTPIRADGNGSSSSNNNKSDSTRSSTSSWSEEPINSVNMDITTGHVILSYMEEHLNEKNRLAKEWEALSQYEPDLVKCDAGKTPQNMTKNRYSNILPYDHTRVKLTENKDNNYINANFIIDDDPKNPAYIATQGPLIHTTSDFWQMVWEQGSVLIISLCRTVEYGSLKCNQFWPANGFELYDKFEIHLVSEHVWCEDYLVRNFFLKNLETSQTRTVTQFHFLTWPENGIPSNIKSILDFRRKVNKSYKGKSSPIIVHCNDGVGRTGTYVLIDMVLNKITKGAKEIDLAATLEFLRDQRFGMVKNKNQFEFSFAVVTEEVQNMLKALNHQ